MAPISRLRCLFVTLKELSTGGHVINLYLLQQMFIMNRKHFLQMMSVFPVAYGLSSIGKWYDDAMEGPNTDLMPLLFLGHGSPMNGIEDNPYSRKWKELGEKLPRPRMVLVVSAHWLTRGTYVTAMENPRTIYDFGGFPEALYKVKYPAPGSPEMAREVADAMGSVQTGMDHDWGLDHGTWTIVRHMYPEANIPVLQLSIDYHKDAQWHYKLAADLQKLRKKGVLIIGSGNIVHNLSRIRFDGATNFAYDWAIQANDEMKNFVMDGNHQALIDYEKRGSAWQLAIPSPDHYYPLIYMLGVAAKGERVQVFNDVAALGSITMTSFQFG